MIKKLNFGEGAYQNNLKFFSCQLVLIIGNVYKKQFIIYSFSVDETQLYTVQNPPKGASYFTVWNVSDYNLIYKIIY